MAKPLLSAETIYAAALELLTEEGLGALTVRNLTSRLHCSTVTLYQQVGNREQLLRGLVTYAFEQIDVDFSRNDDWRVSVTSWCMALRRALLDRPDLARLMTAADRDVVVRYVNRLVRVLVSDGFSTELAVEACRVLSHATLSMTLADLAAPSGPDRPDYFASTIRWLVCGIERDLAELASPRK